MQSNMPLNVLGTELACCCTNPLTGYYRDGFCKTDESDFGKHVICAIVTNEFLQFSYENGNDLITPNPFFSFPGLKEGDKWCLCATRWKEAYIAGKAPKVILECTHAKALSIVSLQQLKEYAIHSY
jgi:uncharacterized protein